MQYIDFGDLDQFVKNDIIVFSVQVINPLCGLSLFDRQDVPQMEVKPGFRKPEKLFLCYAVQRRSSLRIKSVLKCDNSTIQMKATEEYFPVVL